MDEKEIEKIRKEKIKQNQDRLIKQNAVKEIYYIGKKPFEFKKKLIKKDKKLIVNQFEYDDLIQDRNFMSPGDYKPWKKAWEKRFQERVKADEKAKKEAEK